MEWFIDRFIRKHPRHFIVGVVLMAIYGAFNIFYFARDTIAFFGPILSKYGYLFRSPAWIVVIATVVIGWAIFFAVRTRRVLSHKTNATADIGDRQQPSSTPPAIITPTQIPNRREALELAKVAWGLWHTGHRNRIDRLLSIESLSRVLILNPNADGQEIGVVARRSGETIESLIIQIQDTTRDALRYGKRVKWYPQHRESSFTIVDTTPIEEDGILKPRSDNAWMYVEYLNPDVGVDQRQGGPIYNRGKDKPRFMGFFQEYEYIWDKESIPAKQESNSQTKELKAEPHLGLFGLPYTRKKRVSGFGEPSFCLVQFCNKPNIRSPEANAPKVFATTTFYDMEGVKLLELDRVRPTGMPQPTSQDPRVSLREHYYEVEFSANGSPREYTIAYKYDSDDFCYAFDDLVYYSKWRKREYQLPGDSYYVRFYLSGENTEGTWWFVLRNYHQDKEPTLEVAPEPDFYKKGSQT